MWELRGRMIADRTYDKPASRVSLWVKDIELTREFASQLGAATPLLGCTAAIFEQAQEHGLGDWDASAVHKVIEGMEPGS